MRATRWRKLGLIYEPKPIHVKLLTHAANPLALQVEADLYRVFFSGRDANARSSVGYFDFDMASRAVVRVCEHPSFTHGPAESFYSHGVSIGTCYETPDARFILFMGWHIPTGGHWRGEIGALRLDDDLSLSLAATAPILPLTGEDPISLSYPWVIPGTVSGYRMWYGSTIRWDAGNGEMLHVIKEAVSADGMTWQRGEQAIPHVLGTVQAFSRPTVVADGHDGLRMWFSYRGVPGKTYRIGEALCDRDGHWTLLINDPGIDISSKGWDSKMIEYPFVFRHAGETYMLYNGNGFGRSGVGLAIAEGAL